MNKKRINLNRLFANKTFAICASILLAFIIWLVVMINQNPVREQVFTDVSANISVENTAVGDMGLGIVTDLSKQKFTVTVSGPNYIVSSLKTDDFVISADLSPVNAPGKYTLKLHGNRNSNVTGYTFTSISPDTIDVSFDYIDSKTFTIVPKLIGVTAEEGLIAESPVVSNSEQSEITVKGPRGTVEKIGSVGSIAEVNKTLSASQTYDSYVVIYDKNGEILFRYSSDGKIYNKNDSEVSENNLNLTYTTLKVTQPISKKKSVAVEPTFENLPSGITVNTLDISVDHSNVTVIGNPKVIDSLNTISLSPIDFRNVSSTNNSFEIKANLPEGVKLLDAFDFFTVKVNNSGFGEKTFTVKDIRFENLGEGLKATRNNALKNVKICGPKDIIEKVTLNDIYATVDVKDKASGAYEVEATIKSDKFNNIWAVGTYNVSLTIK